jgi:hypothetical protein
MNLNEINISDIEATPLPSHLIVYHGVKKNYITKEDRDITEADISKFFFDKIKSYGRIFFTTDKQQALIYATRESDVNYINKKEVNPNTVPIVIQVKVPLSHNVSKWPQLGQFKNDRIPYAQLENNIGLFKNKYWTAYPVMEHGGEDPSLAVFDENIIDIQNIEVMKNPLTENKRRFVLKENNIAFDNWVIPSDQKLEIEFKYEYQGHNRDEETDYAWETLQDFIQAVNNSEVEIITPEIDNRIGYRSGCKTKEDLISLISTYRSWPEFRNERTLQAIYDGFYENKPMDMPIILKFPDGWMSILSGNTRADIAMQLVGEYKAIILEVPEDDENDIVLEEFRNDDESKPYVKQFLTYLNNVSVNENVRGEVSIDKIIDNFITDNMESARHFYIKTNSEAGTPEADSKEIFDKAISKFKKKIKIDNNTNTVLIYRSIQIPFDDIEYYDEWYGTDRGIGNSWGSSVRYAVSYGSGSSIRRSVEVILYGRVAPENIKWEYTMHLHVEMDFESEIRTEANSPVEIYKIKTKKGDVISLKNPITVLTGPEKWAVSEGKTPTKLIITESQLKTIKNYILENNLSTKATKPVSNKNIKKVYITENQLCLLKKGVELESPRLPKLITQQILSSKTSLGDNPAFPPDTEVKWTYTLLYKEYENVLSEVKTISPEVNINNPIEVKKYLSKLLKECYELEKPIKEQLEKAVLNCIKRIFNISKDDMNLTINMVDRITKSDVSAPLTPEAVEDIEFDGIDEIQGINDEIYKRRIVDSLMQGLAARYLHLPEFYVNDIYKLNPDLLPKYRKILALNELMLFYDNPNKIDEDEVYMGSTSNVILRGEDQSIINVKGVNFLALLHEGIRAVLDLISVNGLPKDRKMMNYVLKKSTFRYSNVWDTLFGKPMWYMIESKLPTEDDGKLLPVLFYEIVRKDVNDFNLILQNVFANTKKGKMEVQLLYNIAKYKVDKEKFNNRLQQKQKLIVDNPYMTPDELY